MNTNTIATLSPLVVQPNDGDVFPMSPVEQFIWKATAAMTDGAFEAFESSMQPGVPGVPEHIHDTVDELFYILQGELRFKIDDDFSTALAGAFVYLPKGTPHAWVNADAGVTRALTLFVPGGMQGMFEVLSPLMQANPPDFAAIAQAAGRFHTRIVGPPIAP